MIFEEKHYWQRPKQGHILQVVTIKEYYLTKFGWLQISYIPDRYFDKLPNLVTLDLQRNMIMNINQSTFKGAVKLKYLKLAWNNLSYIHPEALTSLVRLNYLDVSYTHLHALPPVISNPPGKSIITQVHQPAWKMTYFREFLSMLMDCECYREHWLTNIREKQLIVLINGFESRLSTSLANWKDQLKAIY